MLLVFSYCVSISWDIMIGEKIKESIYNIKEGAYG